jgi:hypothetical protein
MTQKNSIMLLRILKITKRFVHATGGTQKKSDIYAEKSKIIYFTSQPFFKRKT